MSQSKFEWRQFFPFKEPRKQQIDIIDFALNAFINENKKYVLMEAATGIGKSAIGVTIARYMNANQVMLTDVAHQAGAYFLTTQKILQSQYTDDFGGDNGEMLSLKSASNFTCENISNQTCAEVRRSLEILKKHKCALDDSFRRCAQNCCYKRAKDEFKSGLLGVTNFAYFLAETTYAGQLTPRELLVIDETHVIEDELAAFIEVTFSERFAKSLGVKYPKSTDDMDAVFKWMKTRYKPALAKKIKLLETMISNDVIKGSSLNADLTRQYETLDKHICKVNRFIKVYTPENWILNVVATPKGRKLEFKPIDVSPFADDTLFKYGAKVLMMSATVINKDVFCRNLGLKPDEVAFISVDSPFTDEQRPIHYTPVGKMSADQIDQTLPKIAQAVEMLLEQHKEEKGLLHCVSFKVANYIRDHVKNSRLLIHDDTNREATLKCHITCSAPTVLVSPSMMEGIDLHDDLSRFQIFCKVPYPYIGDKQCQKRMERDPEWYPFKTAKNIIQAIGRSVRNDKDFAVTYILDLCFESFYLRNLKFFPGSFKRSLDLSK
jgi:ATP-dependent DNA helicase DinG